MSKTIKLFNFGVIALLLVTAFAIPTLAQDDPKVAECNTIYNEKFYPNRKDKPEVAYEAAKEYLQKCKDIDQKLDTYLKGWIDKYDVEILKIKVNEALGKKNYTDAYKIGKELSSKELFTKAPDNLDYIIKLGFAGFYAVKDRKTEAYSDSETYAKMAIQKIEAGLTPSSWGDFKGKENALSYLYYTLGLVTKESAPKESAKYFYKVTKIEAQLKTDASTYYQIAIYYRGEYQKKDKEVKAKCPDGAPDSDECKALDNDVFARLDRWADALARAVSYSTVPADKKAWTITLQEIFEQRYKKPEAVNDYIVNIQKTPMPDPDSELKPAPIMEVAADTAANTAAAIASTTTTTSETSAGPMTNVTGTTESNGNTATTPNAAPKTKAPAKAKGKRKRP